MLNAKTILRITYPDGTERSLVLAGTVYRRRSASGRTTRISPATARETIEEFDELCNEGEAKLAEIDEAAVAAARLI